MQSESYGGPILAKIDFVRLHLMQPLKIEFNQNAVSFSRDETSTDEYFIMKQFRG
jgi:hypothetical protein